MGILVCVAFSGLTIAGLAICSKTYDRWLDNRATAAIANVEKQFKPKADVH